MGGWKCRSAQSLVFALVLMASLPWLRVCCGIRNAEFAPSTPQLLIPALFGAALGGRR